MTKIEALELELAARKMVEGTKLEWIEVLRDKHTKAYVGYTLPRAADDYELALGIIEGKPVWAGDTLYGECGADRADTNMLFPGKWSWPPLKPKTGMIELSLEDILHWSTYAYMTPQGSGDASNRLYKECYRYLQGI